MYQKTYDLVMWGNSVTCKFAKVHKYSLGVKLENSLLEFLEMVVKANVMENKKYWIQQAMVKFQIIKVFVRIAREINVISKKQYRFASELIFEVGNLLGGWYKKYK